MSLKKPFENTGANTKLPGTGEVYASDIIIGAEGEEINYQIVKIAVDEEGNTLSTSKPILVDNQSFEELVELQKITIRHLEELNGQTFTINDTK